MKILVKKDGRCYRVRFYGKIEELRRLQKFDPQKIIMLETLLDPPINHYTPIRLVEIVGMID